MTPKSYELRRIVNQARPRFWRFDLLEGFGSAPLYFFPDAESFNSDEVEKSALAMKNWKQLLPHPSVIFEVRNGLDSQTSNAIAYCHQRDYGIEAICLMLFREPRKWSDVTVRVEIDNNGFSVYESNPKATNDKLAHECAFIATGLVGRALAILANSAKVEDRKVPDWKRPSLARKGVAGWTFHQVTIDQERLTKNAPQGGTHASPRWHIRRGHWRELPDGRRVFVRQCEVGDPARGGVIKDYIVGAQP